MTNTLKIARRVCAILITIGLLVTYMPVSRAVWATEDAEQGQQQTTEQPAEQEKKEDKDTAKTPDKDQAEQAEPQKQQETEDNKEPEQKQDPEKKEEPDKEQDTKEQENKDPEKAPEEAPAEQKEQENKDAAEEPKTDEAQDTKEPVADDTSVSSGTTTVTEEPKGAVVTDPISNNTPVTLYIFIKDNVDPSNLGLDDIILDDESTGHDGYALAGVFYNRIADPVNVDNITDDSVKEGITNGSVKVYLNGTTFKATDYSNIDYYLMKSSIQLKGIDITTTDNEYKGDLTKADIFGYLSENADKFAESYTGNAYDTVTLPGNPVFDTLNISGGATVSLDPGHVTGSPYDVYYVLTVNVLNVSGTLNVGGYNKLIITKDGTLYVPDGGEINLGDGSCLKLCSGSNVNGVTLYDSDGETVFTLQTNHPDEEFFYDVVAGRFVRNAGEGPGPDPDDGNSVISIRAFTKNIIGITYTIGDDSASLTDPCLTMEMIKDAEYVTLNFVSAKSLFFKIDWSGHDEGLEHESQGNSITLKRPDEGWSGEYVLEVYEHGLYVFPEVEKYTVKYQIDNGELTTLEATKVNDDPNDAGVYFIPQGDLSSATRIKFFVTPNDAMLRGVFREGEDGEYNFTGPEADGSYSFAIEKEQSTWDRFDAIYMDIKPMGIIVERDRMDFDQAFYKVAGQDAKGFDFSFNISASELGNAQSVELRLLPREDRKITEVRCKGEKVENITEPEEGREYYSFTIAMPEGGWNQFIDIEVDLEGDRGPGIYVNRGNNDLAALDYSVGAYSATPSQAEYRPDDQGGGFYFIATDNFGSQDVYIYPTAAQGRVIESVDIDDRFDIVKITENNKTYYKLSPKQGEHWDQGVEVNIRFEGDPMIGFNLRNPKTVISYAKYSVDGGQTKQDLPYSGSDENGIWNLDTTAFDSNAKLIVYVKFADTNKTLADFDRFDMNRCVVSDPAVNDDGEIYFEVTTDNWDDYLETEIHFKGEGPVGPHGLYLTNNKNDVKAAQYSIDGGVTKNDLEYQGDSNDNGVWYLDTTSFDANVTVKIYVTFTAEDMDAEGIDCVDTSRCTVSNLSVNNGTATFEVTAENWDDDLQAGIRFKAGRNPGFYLTNNRLDIATAQYSTDGGTTKNDLVYEGDDNNGAWYFDSTKLAANTKLTVYVTFVDANLTLDDIAGLNFLGDRFNVTDLAVNDSGEFYFEVTPVNGWDDLVEVGISFKGGPGPNPEEGKFAVNINYTAGGQITTSPEPSYYSTGGNRITYTYPCGDNFQPVSITFTPETGFTVKSVKVDNQTLDISAVAEGDPFVYTINDDPGNR